ncbi:hypothetical protein BT69DRAFT_1287175 [Atractiella rhizophila]|nr:hypothetical protein BT69DRAFT_1287175 [Atractiella rhizophila]
MGWLLEEYIGLTMLMIPASALVDTVERKQGERHQGNYVHGDVRETYVLLSRTKIKLFYGLRPGREDWEARYPMNLKVRGCGDLTMR